MFLVIELQKIHFGGPLVCFKRTKEPRFYFKNPCLCKENAYPLKCKMLWLHLNEFHRFPTVVNRKHVNSGFELSLTLLTRFVENAAVNFSKFLTTKDHIVEKMTLWAVTKGK